MTTRPTNDSRQQTREAQAPQLIAWHVTERNGKKFWTRIGAAWDHDDAKGLTLQLDLMPVGVGRIVLREPADDTAAGDGGA